ncbi:MAG TPA: hypothetical protein P5279_08340 [Anaerohalosphaeraceae bacterium]|jgi:hypothetical protein|nr:hypothetical protein [Anaerohalosphaeraceae bacterium]HRT50485.1 hypothetical protein [Anaerohalosphaeraceae bacterium]HRT86415.1 hypothetical protein [Anaerohalosphaeraceae bacterium]
MSKAYKRKAGDFEIRILPDGRVVMLAPDEAMMEVARAIEGQENHSEQTDEGNHDKSASADGTGG